MALACHFNMEGEKQGKIEGSCEMEGREGSHIGHWFAHQVTMPHNLMDGFSTAKPGHYPLEIIIGHDKCSPKLHQALCTGEHMKYVEIKWYRVNKYGNEEHYFTFRLEDAVIIRIESFMPNTLSPHTAHLPYMEKVSFSYRYIRWTYEPTGIEAEDPFPYMNEYDNPWKAAKFVALAVPGFVYGCKKMATKKAKDVLIDVGLARLLEFLKAPWYVMEAYDQYQKIKNERDNNDFIDHDGRETAERFDHNLENARDQAFKP
jgi:type VI secretion system secreted protein Hcp